MIRTNVVRNFSMKRFEEWLKENNKVKNDIAFVEYLAVVMEDEEAKKCWEKYQNGEITEDDIAIISCAIEPTEEQIEGFKKIVVGVGQLLKKKNPEKLIENINNDYYGASCKALIECLGEEFEDLYEKFEMSLGLSKMLTELEELKNDSKA